MDLKNKNIWDINLKELEYIYTNLHMDNYVYCGCKLFHTTEFPLYDNKKLKKESIPNFIYQPIKELVELSSSLEIYDSKEFRSRYTYLSYRLYKELNHVNSLNLDIVIKLLSCLAYISIIADKNDNLLLWRFPVIRDVTDEVKNVFEEVCNGITVSDFFLLPSIKENRWNQFHTVYTKIEEFVIRAVEHIIIMIENNADKSKISKAFYNVQKQMIAFEIENDIGNKNRFFANIRNPYQIRYRNTLYLYGGNHFERINLYEEAFDWYTKDIYILNIKNICNVYLTTLKTIERFLCAYHISDYVKEKKGFLLSIINNCLLKAFEEVSDYGSEIIEFLEKNPDFDKSEMNIPHKSKKSTHENTMHFAGEAAREIYLISLLYNKIIFGVDYKDIDYYYFIN